MLFIGITGGVGAGKSEILSYLNNKPKVRVMLADEIAHDVMEPGGIAYDSICQAFAGDDIFPDGATEAKPAFDRKKLAQVIFQDAGKRDVLNQIVHPAVKAYVKEQYLLELQKDELSVLVLEAALLIEENYREFCQELWYIYTTEENRRSRLKAARGYSDEKISGIFAAQMTEEVFRAHCVEVIDNNGSKEAAFAQIDQALERAFDRHKTC